MRQCFERRGFLAWKGNYAIYVKQNAMTHHALYAEGLSVKSSLGSQILDNLQKREIW
jgi:hypothetical protein